MLDATYNNSDISEDRIDLDKFGGGHAHCSDPVRCPEDAFC
jgi:hypothetical protein